MKSRGAIQAFTIALALSCLFYMSFSVVTYMVERNADEYAASKTDAEADVTALRKQYLDSMASVDVYNIGITSYTYSDCKKNKLNLGLDLQGGMHVTLEVALDKLIKRLSGNQESETLKKALELANERQLTSQEPYVDLFYDAFKEVAGDESLFRVFDTPENRDKFDRESENRDEEVLKFIRSEAEQAVQRTQDIIRTRIDEFGVTQPTIRQEGASRITIELPGVDDTERVRKLLKRSAKLEFWETYGATDMINKHFVSVNEVLAAKLGLDDKKKDATDTTGTADATDTTAASTTADIASTPNTDEKSDKDETAPVLEKEGDSLAAETGDSAQSDSLKDAAAQKEAAAKVPLYQKLRPQVDFNNQNQIMEGPVVGTAFVNDTGIIMTYLNYPEVKAVLPADVKFLWSVNEVQEGSRVFSLYALKTERGKAPLDGSVITDAFQNYDQITGKPDVNMKMNPAGARRWKAMTEANIDKWIAISLDNKVYSAPQVNSVIPNGSSVIQGGFSIEEAKDLASVLKAGKLPVTVDIAEEETVGPTLGAESVRNGLISLVIGFLLVLFFMGFYYRSSGLVANIALFANLFFIIGILSSLHAALTLPGMAGIVLTIGMAVDANVLIFERIREELKAGKSLKAAIEDGYRNAYSSIIDSNLTTFLTGIILLIFGKGPISGFAVILVIGILTSLFCAIFLSRLIFTWMLAREKPISFGSEKTTNMLSGLNFDFMAKRKLAYIVSGSVIVIGLISLMTRGLNLSVDFEGGRTYVVQFDENTSVTEVRDLLTPIFGSSPEVKTYGSPSKHKITTKYRINDNNDNVDQEVQEVLQTTLGEKYPDGFVIEKSQKVGPTFARDIEISAILSILVGLIGIFLYIVVRFRKWQYGLGALVALVHDVLLVIGLFSLLWGVLPINLEVDQAFIAAILTVVGYSINDTVVVFDRIREMLSLHPKSPLYATINTALNQTISRTLITSLTTLLVVLILFLLGGEIIRGFSFALLIGITVGTYSSLFIATPIVVDLDRSGRKKE